MLLRVLWLALLFSLSAAELIRAGQGQLLLRRRLEAKETLIRLGTSSIRFFHGRRPPLGAAFWTEIKRPPLLDPWGHPFEIESPREGLILWRSYGPDGLRNTPDDILYPMPYGEEPVPSSQPAVEQAMPRFRSAK